MKYKNEKKNASLYPVLLIYIKFNILYIYILSKRVPGINMNRRKA